MNKKNLFVIIIPLFSFFENIAQIPKNNLIFGSGLSVSAQAKDAWKHYPSLKDVNNIKSVYAGIYYQRHLKYNLSVRAGFQHIEKGFQYYFESNRPLGTSFKTRYEHRLNYIELPISIHYHYKSIGVSIGGIVSYLYEPNYRYLDIMTANRRPPTTVYASSFFSQYPYYRFQDWDMGVSMNLSYRFNDYIELNAQVQKHFYRIDKFVPKGIGDVMYNHVYMLGLNFNILSFK